MEIREGYGHGQECLSTTAVSAPINIPGRRNVHDFGSPGGYLGNGHADVQPTPTLPSVFMYNFGCDGCDCLRCRNPLPPPPSSSSSDASDASDVSASISSFDRFPINSSPSLCLSSYLSGSSCFSGDEADDEDFIFPGDCSAEIFDHSNAMSYTRFPDLFDECPTSVFPEAVDGGNVTNQPINHSHDYGSGICSRFFSLLPCCGANSRADTLSSISSSMSGYSNAVHFLLDSDYTCLREHRDHVFTVNRRPGGNVDAVRFLLGDSGMQNCGGNDLTHGHCDPTDHTVVQVAQSSNQAQASNHVAQPPVKVTRPHVVRSYNGIAASSNCNESLLLELLFSKELLLLGILAIIMVILMLLGHFIGDQ
ncbi:MULTISPECIES: hypothetical protein [Candidatus Ichthyocystis]|uniref:Putative membrane protein n=1 Tax=Candidatus Ichthyocystis hellenicum TaxID=1561003 RepID=A0A0S4M3P5_9BURK|nr:MULTISPECIES: hypothetical protein [Ichthyocystis]CUT17915.1 putative membrane protein [Candidatus Ichthyocystis hellenicum]